MNEKILKRFICPHFYWHEVSPFELGSFHRGVMECEACGKRKLFESLKDYEVIVERRTDEHTDKRD